MDLLAAGGGDTVKLFDVSVQSGGDPCTLSYTPSPGFQVNSVKWNHTNLVVASAGDDKRISFWRANGRSMWTIPVAVAADIGDNVEEDVLCINFSNKGSRYLCSAGSGQVVRIWDLQRKLCIKRLKGHTGTITGAMYNCKDEHLASISLTGDLILHNLASGSKATVLKDPNKQVLRVLDYSGISRHLLVTAGDDGSIHLWDTTSRSPKISWSKQHSAPTAGVSFSPNNDKIIASVGLDKKLCTFDSGMRRESFSIAYEVPFSSLAFRDDGLILAAGTSSGCVIFYDLRGKPHPFTVLHAYTNSEAVTSLCWQRSRSVVLNESTCTDEAALLGGAFEGSTLMPDPLPSAASLSLSQSIAVSKPGSLSRLSHSTDSLPHCVATSGYATSTHNASIPEQTPNQNPQWPSGTLGKIHMQRTYNFKDDMDVFSPLVEVQSVTPSLDKLWNNYDVDKSDQPFERTPSLLSKTEVLQPAEDNMLHPVFDWKSNWASKDSKPHSLTQVGPQPASSERNDPSGFTHEATWGEILSDNLARQQIGSFSSHLSKFPSVDTNSTSMFNAMRDPISASMDSMTTSGIDSTALPAKDTYSSLENSAGISGHIPFSSLSLTPGTKPFASHTNLESSGPASFTFNRKPSTYAQRISTPSFGDGTSTVVASQKTKRTAIETADELLTGFSRSDISSAVGQGTLSSTDGTLSPHHKPSSYADIQQQGSSSFTIKLFQRTVEETLSSFQESIHKDVRNLHIEVLRQFHMHEMEMSSTMNSILDNQAELMKEIQALRKENQELRQFLR